MGMKARVLGGESSVERWFWQIIDSSRGPDDARADVLQEARMREILRGMSANDVIKYERQFVRLFWLAYRWDLWEAATLIDYICTDDGFMDFRFWLISAGRETFYKAVADPDTLAAVRERSGCATSEAFGYLGNQVYREKTGNEMGDLAVPRPWDPMGERTEDPKAQALRYKKLWAKFGDREP